MRVAAYAVCRHDDAVLLARWTSPHGPRWTLPGGGVDHGEDPADAAVREVREETGFDVRLNGLLTVHSFRTVIRDAAEPIDHHGIQIVYGATVVGGELRFETDGSTDMAAWFPVAEVGALDRVQLVDVGLAAANLVR
jgi:ADP-ribose pyrophosphatase YjhB (NUDIX family)